MSCAIPSLKLRDGNTIPVLGLGTYMASGHSVTWALEKGYRLIDTASLYNNEEQVGRSIRQSGVAREDVFVVTKLWNSDHGYKQTKASFHKSLESLGLDYVDLYLMHSAMGGQTVDTWTAMVELKREGFIRSVGVANFNKHHLVALQQSGPKEMPVVNQIETHPFLWWEDCVAYCRDQGIAVMAYSPLAKAEKLRDTTLCSIASKHGRSAAQVMIKWSLQQGFVCIPKTDRKNRLEENKDIFDIQLSPADMEALTGLAQGYISDWPGAMDSRWTP